VLSVVFAQFVTVLIELGVLTVALLIAGNMVLPWLPVLFVIMVLLAIFSTGVAMLLASANVFFNDITYLWAIAAQLLFYATPVIWDPESVGEPWLTNIASWLPTGAFVMAIHEVMYDLHMPSLARFTQLTLYALVSLAIGAWGFNRLSPKFAEVL
jgi:ABC-type polysaccharide/polyol phosphate export permease